MNEYDSELIESILTQAGYGLVQSVIDADIILLNTCAVRENAQRKVFGHIHEIRHKRQGRPAIYGILGCIATHLQNEILEDKSLRVDLIAGPDSYRHLPELISRAVNSHEKSFDLNLSDLETYENIYPRRTAGINAWVAIMRGCNNFCTFCVVPYTRGRERSRLPKGIVDEIKKSADEGFSQVTLLGQNVNSYKYEDCDFPDLLTKISKIKNIKRIRFTSPHPKDMPEKLLKTMAENPKICKQIHFPFQSGNDRILKMMNRSYTQAQYLNLVKQMRQLMPEIAISTDIIVGFPTETDEEYEDTLKVVREVGFDSAFMFKYSERKGTAAAKKFKDDVPEEKKTERIVKLNEIQKEICLKKNQAHVGQIQEILIERKGTAKTYDKCQGRNDANKLVTIPDNNYSIGQFINVKITDATPHVLRGEAL